MTHPFQGGSSVLQVKCRIHEVHVFLVQFFPQKLHRFAEALEVNHLPFPQELDYVIYIRIIGQTQDVIIGYPGLLFWHTGIKATNIYRNIRNKRLIAIKNEQFLLYTLLYKVRVQAVLK